MAPKRALSSSSSSSSSSSKKAKVVDLTEDDDEPQEMAVATGGRGSKKSSPPASKKAPTVGKRKAAASAATAAAPAPEAKAAPVEVDEYKGKELLPLAELVAWLTSSESEDADPDVISMEGICKMLKVLGMEMEDVSAILLLHKLGAGSKPGVITKAEFIEGMEKKVRKSNLAGLKSIAHQFDPGFLDIQQFRDFFGFVFKFNLESTHKTLDKALVVDLLQLMLKGSGRASHLELFVEFLESDTCSDKVVTADQWNSFLTFNQEVSLDLSDFSDDSAW